MIPQSFSRTLLENLNQAGNTIILVTHEADIAHHARRTVHLRDGLIESDALSEATEIQTLAFT
jgi:ABC-type lipoprotein export system ATPase subunit